MISHDFVVSGTIVVLAAMIVSGRLADVAPIYLLISHFPQLLILVSVSVPILKSIWFLKANVQGYEVTLGTWGVCTNGGNCTSARLGYDLGDHEVYFVSPLRPNVNFPRFCRLAEAVQL